MRISCVYQIKNSSNNKKYIGSTVDYNRRKYKHILLLNKNSHHSQYLQNAWNLHGYQKFEFSILELVDDKSKLLEREDYYVKLINPEYNTMKDIKSHLGLKRSEETRRKMSLAQLGKKHTRQTKEKLSRIFTGLKQTDETIKKRIVSMKSSVSFQNAIKSKERNDKVKKTRIEHGGYVVSDEQKRKISETLKSKNLQSAISIKIQKFDLNGNFIKEYPSFKKAEVDNGFGRGCLYHNISKLKKNEYKGFIWKKVN